MTARTVLLVHGHSINRLTWVVRAWQVIDQLIGDLIVGGATLALHLFAHLHAKVA